MQQTKLNSLEANRVQIERNQCIQLMVDLAAPIRIQMVKREFGATMQLQIQCRYSCVINAADHLQIDCSQSELNLKGLRRRLEATKRLNSTHPIDLNK